MKPERRKVFAAIKTFSGQCCSVSWSGRNNVFPPGCAVVSMDNRCSAREHQTLLSLPLSSHSPSFVFFPPPLVCIQVTFPLLWSSPSHLPHPSFPAPHMRHEGRSDRGATVLRQSKLFSCPAPVIRQRCKCQLKCQHRAGPPFISAFWRNSLLRSPHKTLSWDRVHFNPFVLLFFLIPYRGTGKLESVRKLLLSREPPTKLHYKPGLQMRWFRRPHQPRSYLGLTGFSWTHPKDYELVFRNQMGFLVWDLQIWICCVTSVFVLNVLNWVCYKPLGIPQAQTYLESVLDFENNSSSLSFC